MMSWSSGKTPPQDRCVGCVFRTWPGLQVGGGPFAELEMVYDLIFFPALVGLCTAVARHPVVSGTATK